MFTKNNSEPKLKTICVDMDPVQLAKMTPAVTFAAPNITTLSGESVSNGAMRCRCTGLIVGPNFKRRPVTWIRELHRFLCYNDSVCARSIAIDECCFVRCYPKRLTNQLLFAGCKLI